MNNKNTINTPEYKLKCNDCDAVYIEQTCRSFTIRIKEHKIAYRDEKLGSSSFADHLIDKKHASEFNPDIIHSENKELKLTIRESFEISRTPTAINEYLD